MPLRRGRKLAKGESRWPLTPFPKTPRRNDQMPGLADQTTPPPMELEAVQGDSRRQKKRAGEFCLHGVLGTARRVTLRLEKMRSEKNPWRRAPRMLLVAGAITMGFGFPGCAKPPPAPLTELDCVRDPHFQMEIPPPGHFATTGIGCGATEKKALDRARNTAHFNLRGIYGARLNEVVYFTLREVPRPDLICFEVRAQAIF